MSNQIPPIDWYARPDSWTYRMPGFSPLPGSRRVPTPPLGASDTRYQSEPIEYSADEPPVPESSGSSRNQLNHQRVPRLGTRPFPCRGS